jgi:hypothetical protein
LQQAAVELEECSSNCNPGSGAPPCDAHYRGSATVVHSRQPRGVLSP